jgi:hypothetical protein
MKCPGCGGDIVGDGVTLAYHCENVDLPNYREADAAPLYCSDEFLLCPECGEQLDRINCYTVCLRKCSLDKEGVAHDFGEAEPFPYDAHYECPECAYELTDMIKGEK